MATTDERRPVVNLYVVVAVTVIVVILLLALADKIAL